MKDIIEKIEKLPDGRDVCVVGFHGGELDAECHIGSTDELKALAQFARDAAEALKHYADRHRWDWVIGKNTHAAYRGGANGYDKAQAVIAKHAELLKETK